MADVECPVCGKLCKASQINSHVNKCLNATETQDRPKRGNSETEEKESVDCQPAKRLKTTADETVQDSQSSEQSEQNGGRSSLVKAWSFMKSPTSGNSSHKTKNPTSKNGNETKSIDSITTVNTVGIDGVPHAGREEKINSMNNFNSHAGDNKSSTKSKGTQNTPSEGKSNAVNDSSHDQKNVRQGLFKSSPKDGNINTAQIIKTGTFQLSANSSGSNLGNKQKQQKKQEGVPLPERMRPRTFTDYVGQEKVIGKNKLLRSLLESDRIPSMIIWGPPGCGKTTLAKIIAARCKETHNTKFITLSATTAGVADVKEIVKIAKNDLKMFHRRTILFVDEIHRFNKLQQDTFLPHVEDGTISLIGATTENPSFQVNNALMSRCKVIILEKLSLENVITIVRKAMDQLGITTITSKEPQEINNNDSIGFIEEESILLLANMCDGDARAALNCLQIAMDSVLTTSDSNTSVITVDHIKETLQRSHVQYDRKGEEHYNCASAFQKSIRGSSENGAIFWLARMLEGGEDPLFIARRLVVTASEDIGMADPQALPLAVATFQACQVIGLPECAINLGHCTTYLARAPKSNESYLALTKARDMIKNFQGPIPGVPLHLRNAPTKLLKDMGCGQNYKYSHNYPGSNEQQYLPDQLKGVNFFDKSYAFSEYNAR